MTDPVNKGQVERFRGIIVDFLNGQNSTFNGVQVFERKVGDPDDKLAEALDSANVYGEVSIFQTHAKIAPVQGHPPGARGFLRRLLRERPGSTRPPARRWVPGAWRKAR